jgi:hypothetical protein
MAVAVIMRVPMIMSVLVPLVFGVTPEVVGVIMPMRRRRIDRLGNPALLADLRRLGHFVIVFVPPSPSMRCKPPYRRLIHVAR